MSDELDRRNPWPATPAEPPYVLHADEPFTDGLFELWKVPCPWSGPAFSASALVLLLNPGLGEAQDRLDLATPGFLEMAREQLSGRESWPWSHWPDTGGGRYWHPRLKRLTSDVGAAAVEAGLAAVELVPYASRWWSMPAARLPSATFTAMVVRSAMDRGALMIVARGWRHWTDLVPELATASRVTKLRSPRSPYLTPGNMEAGQYEELVAALRPTPERWSPPADPRRVRGAAGSVPAVMAYDEGDHTLSVPEEPMTTRATTAVCGIDGRGEPRHLTATGRADPTLCAAHDRMLSVLKSELIRRSGNSVGATELLGRVEAARVG